MKFIKLFLITWCFAVHAGLPPTTLSGQNSATKPTTFNFKTPYYQSTQTSGINSLIETDSENMLVNPNFEHGTISTGWTLGTSNTLTATTTSANLFSGKQAGLLTTSATVAFNFYQDVTPPSGLAGTQGEITWALNVPSGITDGQICSRINGTTSTTNCISVINNGVYREYSLPIIFGTAGQTAGLAFVTTATYASGAQTVIVDKARIRAGLSLSSLNLDNVYSAHIVTTSGTVTNTSKSGWVTCTAANPTVCTFATGLFTVAPNCVTTYTQAGGTTLLANIAGNPTATSVSIQTINSSTGADLATRDFTLICQKQGNDYLSASSSVYSQASSNYGYINGGTMTIGAVTTPPSKGTTTLDRVNYSRDGQNLLADYHYVQSAAGSGGSGNYLFTLPNSLSFDSSFVNYVTTSTIADSAVPKGMVGVGTAVVNDANDSKCVAIAYDATRFRIACFQGGNTNSVFVGSAFLSLASTQVAITVRITAPISGWTNSSQIVGSFSGYANVPGQSGNVDIFKVMYGTTAFGTVCSANPCSYFSVFGTGATSMGWTSAGLMTLNLSRTYSKVSCTGNANGAVGSTVDPAHGVNVSSLTITTRRSDTAAVQNTYGVLDCMGTY